MNARTRNFIVASVTAVLLAVGSSNVVAVERIFLGNDIGKTLSASNDDHTLRTLAALRERVAKSEKVRVIVGVRAAFAPEGKLKSADVVRQRGEISGMQSAVRRISPSFRAMPGKAKAFASIPFMALEVDATELEALVGQTEITSIEEDRLLETTLAESVPVTGGSTAWNMGYTGTGQTVAILDTGVDRTHPFLAGRVVSEACYSTNNAALGARSLCPGGATQSTAADSAMPYAGACRAGACNHGTHVAGIAVGNGAAAGATFSGVAKDASVIAIQVFTRFDGANSCGSAASCVGAYTSDVILGLERVLALHGSYSIAAVNMSLGSGGYSDQASCDAANRSMKTAIDNLRSVGVATIVASGNKSSASKVSSPGCISSAVSVGATTKQDLVASYSNSASFLNLLAPGSAVNSSIPGGGYAVSYGTSMATPHIVGAWALLKQQDPSISVADALNALSSTGTPVTDTRNGIVIPRVQVDAALSLASNTAPTLSYSPETGYGSDSIEPNAGTASTTFTFKIVYADANNIAPSYVRVCIDGTCNAMSKDAGAADVRLRDNNYISGEQYFYSAALGAGAHSYYFDAAHGKTTVALPGAGALSGPAVSNLTITTSVLPHGAIGNPYSATLASNGGVAPTRWSASGLPDGLDIDPSTGAIFGTPIRQGIFGFTVAITDATNAVFVRAFSITIPDIVPPAAPAGLAATPVSETEINLTWFAATDNVGVTAYEIYRDGALLTTVGGVTSYRDTGLTPGSTYSYSLSACDAAGNCSVRSLSDSAITPASPSGRVVAWGNNAYGQTAVPGSLSGVIAIATGGAGSRKPFSVALRVDGTVVAWGDNSVGQTSVPTGLGGVVAIAAGADGSYSAHTVALKNDGTVVAWGANQYGQSTVPAGLSGVVAIAAGSSHTVALRNDGTVAAWGSDTYGKSTVPKDLSGVVAIAAGGSFTVALKNDGTVVAWGGNNDGATLVPVGLNGVVAIKAGTAHTVALKNDGTVVAWGFNHDGQTNIPEGLNGVVAISAGHSNTMALKGDGTVVAWGGDAYGQTSVPTGLRGVKAIAAGDMHSLALVGTASDTVPPSIPTSLTATAASASQINLAWPVSADNVGVMFYKVYRNGDQVGTPAGPSFFDTGLMSITAYHYTVSACDAAENCSAQSPAAVGITAEADTTPPGVPTLLSAGAFSATQTVLSWAASTDDVGVTGYKVYRDGVQVGALTGTGFSETGLSAATTYSYAVSACDATGNCSVQSIPATVKTAVAAPLGTVVAWGLNDSGQATVPAGLGEVTAIAAGIAHSVALKRDGTVAVWGDNHDGQKSVPAGLSGVTAIAAGDYHSLALKRDGTVAAWGGTFNSQGQAAVPAGLGGIVAVAAGALHSLALRSDGTVVAWGSGAQGQTTAPAGLTGVVAIAAGGHVSMALKNDGTVVVWGDSLFRQTMVPKGLNGVIAIALGSLHAMALRNDGTMVAWGTSSWGQTVLPGINDVAAIAAGREHSIALRKDRTVVAWGKPYGQTAVPTGLSRVVAIAAGGNHSIAIASSDGLAPTVPTGLTATAVSATQAMLVWTSAAEIEGVTGYKVYRDGIYVGTSPGTNFIDSELVASKSYSYTVEACDVMANCSPQSGAVAVETLAANNTVPTALNLMPSWNLVGNGINALLSVPAAFGDSSKVSTVWKWKAEANKWAFYAPSMNSSDLAAYALSKGYDVLSAIGGGEGFWVNAKIAFSVPSPAGSAITTDHFRDQIAPAQHGLVTGWNLLATGDNVTPSAFNAGLSVAQPAQGVVPLNVTTLWAWDPGLSSWYFYAPSLAANGTLANYSASKGYLDFAARKKMLDAATGFWINKP